MQLEIKMTLFFDGFSSQNKHTGLKHENSRFRIPRRAQNNIELKRARPFHQEDKVSYKIKYMTVT